MGELYPSEFVLKLRRNLVTLSFFILFYKYSGATIDGNFRVPIFGVTVNLVNVEFVHRSAFYYLLYTLMHFSCHITCHFLTLFAELRKTQADEMNVEMWRTEEEEHSRDMAKDDPVASIHMRYDRMLKFVRNFKIIIILFIECLIPIIASIWGLIVLHYS